MKDPVVFHCEKKFVHPRREDKIIYFQIWVERKMYSFVKEWATMNCDDYLMEGL